MEIRLANINDIELISLYDKHINHNELAISINLKRIYLIFDENSFIGWLRYNLFWDEIPFINMLYILTAYQGQKYGTKLLTYFENKMKNEGYSKILVSTQENETAQYFYQKLGYSKIGGFTLPKEEYELIFYKEI